MAEKKKVKIKSTRADFDEEFNSQQFPDAFGTIADAIRVNAPIPFDLTPAFNAYQSLIAGHGWN